MTQEAHVSKTDGITDEVRKREEEYFRRKDRELIERMRAEAAATDRRKELEVVTGIHDPQSIIDLEALGFTPQTIALLPLVPVLEVAWAEGGISTAERQMILTLARSGRVAAGSEADHQLQAWLETRPAEETFHKARRLIAAMLDHAEGSELQVSAADLIRHCEQIAHASGGLFGFGSVSAEEKAALQQIAGQLKKR
jgi:hypothetical protein